MKFPSQYFDDQIKRCFRCNDPLTTPLDLESGICTACHILVLMKPVDEMAS